MSIHQKKSLIEEFPNVLLLDPSIFREEKKSIFIKEEKKKTPDSVWDVVENIQRNSCSESNQMLSSEFKSPAAQICDGCQSENTFTDDPVSGTIVCSECGMVIEEIMDCGPEWKSYNNEDSRGDTNGRCGIASNYFFPKSSQGTIMKGAMSNRLKQKQSWNTMVYHERNLNEEFEEINKICAKNGISKVIADDVKIFYKKISESKHKSGVNAGKQIIFRGDNRSSIKAACLYKACIKNNNPMDIKTIAKIFNLPEKKVTKGNNQFDHIIKNLDSYNSFNTDSIFCNDTINDYIVTRCKMLKISKEDTDTAIRIAKNCCRMKLATDHNPKSIAAGSILIMVEYCKYQIDKKNISLLFNTSDVTINKIYVKLKPYIRVLVNDEITDHIINKFKING